MKKAIGLKGIFKKRLLRIEGTLEEVYGDQPGYGRPDLPFLAGVKRNPAAKMALDREGYKFNDAPFYYAKMGALGYIISHKDFRFIE